MNPQIITTSGQIAAGTSSASVRLAEKLGYKFLDMGQLFRKLAKNSNSDVLEFQQKVNNNPDIDKQLEQTTLDFIKKHKKVVVTGKTTPWFLHKKKIACYKIFFKAPLEIRAKRLKNRDNKVNLQTAKHELISRERQHRRRYKQEYDIDRSNLSIYNLVVNTANKTVDETVDKILANFS